MGGLFASLAIWWLAPLVCFPPLRVGKQFGALLHSFVLCNPSLKIQVLKKKTIIFHELTIYIEVDYHFICKYVSLSVLHLPQVPTTNQLGDKFY